LQQQKRDVDGLCDRSRQQRKRDYDARTQQLAATVLGSVKKTFLGTKREENPKAAGTQREKREAAHEKGQERERRDLKKSRRQRKEN
jgi:hypothetical protein